MNKGNLLIVDDESMILESLEVILEDSADKIITAANGKFAMDIIETQEVHCILCDINMPEMNGIEVIKAIRKSGNNVPFIFFTAHGNSDLMLELKPYNVFEFINKPGLDDLEEIVSRGLKAGFSNTK